MPGARRGYTDFVMEGPQTRTRSRDRRLAGRPSRVAPRMPTGAGAAGACALSPAWMAALAAALRGVSRAVLPGV